MTGTRWQSRLIDYNWIEKSQMAWCEVRSSPRLRAASLTEDESDLIVIVAVPEGVVVIAPGTNRSWPVAGNLIAESLSLKSLKEYVIVEAAIAA